MAGRRVEVFDRSKQSKLDDGKFNNKSNFDNAPQEPGSKLSIKLIGSESVCNRLISDPEREDNYEKLEYNYHPTPESIFLFEQELKK